MEWLSCIKKTVSLLEEHLFDETTFDVAKEVNISPIYLQKGFSLLTGISIGEYQRNRKLYLAALDVLANKEDLIDIAFKCGYETYESFTKAFVRFHGLSPVALRRNPSKIRVFLPLNIKIEIQGGEKMEYTIEKVPAFKVIGFVKEFSFDEAYAQIPKFWDEFMQKYGCRLMSPNATVQNDVEETICNCIVGKYGICIDNSNGKTFKYMIAGVYTEGDVPDSMVTYEFDEMILAKFKCVGPLPGSLQAVNTKIFKEWLPGNDKYEIAKGINFEYYSNGDPSSVDYQSEIWIPVQAKK